MTAISPLTIAWFDSAFSDGPAYGTQERISWGEFASILEWRREGDKDGCCFVPARFPAGPRGAVRRLKADVVARTAVALDIETSKKTGEVPPSLDDAMSRVTAFDWAAIGYTSHN